jgi:hypothetical protein
MIQTNCNQIISRVKDYVKENWGSPFIIGFMLLLVGAAVSFSLGLSSLADSITVFAFLSLVVGLILQVASLIGINRKIEADAI